MEEYIKWLENRIEVCLEDKDLQREHWAFCQALTKMRELQLLQPDVIKSVCSNCGHKLEEHTVATKLCPNNFSHYKQTVL